MLYSPMLCNVVPEGSERWHCTNSSGTLSAGRADTQDTHMHTHRIQRTHIHTVNGNCTLVNLYFWKGHENNAAALRGESLADASTAAATPDCRGWLSVSISIVQFVQIRMHHFLVDIVAREPEVLVIFALIFSSYHYPPLRKALPSCAPS